jgi:nucleotide-binding universal stress UspA family protein
MEKVQYLRLDGLTVNLTLARRLAPVVACRYHALPVAEANGRITVAMADPDDPVAREAVVSALGAPSYVVRGNPAAIDALLAELWPGVLRRSPRLLVCAHASPHLHCTQAHVIADEVLAFALALSDLLDARVGHFHPKTGTKDPCDALAREVERAGYDLVVWGEPEQSLGRQLLSGPAYCQAIERVPTSLLMVRRPRLPLGRLLLIVRGREIDSVAVDWTVRLAQPSGASVTVLAVVPPVPAMYDRFTRMQVGLDALLTTDTVLGRQMRQVARCLVDWEVEGTLRLRQGLPDGQIQCEVAEGDYDLIALATKSHDRWRRWLMGDQVLSLLRWADRPVLVAKPFGRGRDRADTGYIWGTTDQPRVSPTNTGELGGLKS